MDLERIFKTSIWLPRDIATVFEFFGNAYNLEKITPPWLNFQILNQSTPRIEEGTLLNYKLKIHGFPVYWKTRIESWVPQKSFVDTQLKGPYSLWHHTHLFASQGSGTYMEDIVRYKIPGGRIGDLAVGWWVARDVEEIFEYRKQAITKIFS